MSLAHLRLRCHCGPRDGTHKEIAIRSLRRCSLNQASERDEQVNGGAPAKGILIALLVSVAFWTCLGCVVWHCGGVR